MNTAVAFDHPSMGKFWTLANDDSVGNILHSGHEWEPYLVEALIQATTPGSTMVDVGCFYGSHAKRVAMAVPSATVVAIEAMPVHAELARRNLADCNNAHVVHAAVAAVDGGIVNMRAVDYDIRGNYGGTMRHGLEALSEKQLVIFKKDPATGQDLTVEVPRRNLDSMGLKQVSVIKIDVEGMELDVLKGGMSIIRLDLPCIFIEVWGLHMAKFKSSQVWAAMMKLGYDMVHLKDGMGYDHVLRPPRMQQASPQRMQQAAPPRAQRAAPPRIQQGGPLRVQPARRATRRPAAVPHRPASLRPRVR